jgi:hypothetical protein
MKKINWRNLHRDLGYFYIGLIVSFAFSGLLMNHREMWHPEKYTFETKAIEVKLPAESDINEKYALSIIEKAFEYGHHNNLYTVQETYFIYKCLKKLKDDANKNQRDHLHNDDTNGDIG